MNFVLILTLTMFAGQYNSLSSSHAITSVSGFSSMDECLAAGNAWLKQQRAITSSMQRREVSALCVKRSGT
ncbi:hypothetical protein ACM9XA_03660 [Xanthomonas sacchari]